VYVTAWLRRSLGVRAATVAGVRAGLAGRGNLARRASRGQVSQASRDRQGSRGGRDGWGGRQVAVAVAMAGVVVAGCGAAGSRVPQPMAQAAPAPTATPAPAPATIGESDGSARASGLGGGPGAAAPAAGQPRVAPGSGQPRPPANTTPAGRTAPGPRAPLVVVLDPGHNGGNAAHPDIVNRQVDAGLGKTKPCNSTGTETAAGYPEHAFNFDVAVRARQLLAARGLTVLLTRPDDTGVGPCVDARARFGNAHGAAAVVSIHGDGADPSGSGFHVVEAVAPPAGPEVGAASRRLALAVRAALLAGSGFGYASYVAGGGGLDHRADLAGLNLSTRPAILVECGNMRNPADAARMSSPAGRQRIARALADGVLAALSGPR
jgi:N-acetylmuramoyl-L-alanine amidase